MKLQIAAALLTLLPSVSWTCAVYDNCLCQNADGSFNDAVTKIACGRYKGNYDQFDDGRHYCSAGAINSGVGGGVILDFNNCRFREVCNNYGAMGDSNCWGKE